MRLLPAVEIVVMMMIFFLLTISKSKQGQHSRPYVLDNENLRCKAATWVHSNSSCKGQPNMTAAKFCDWVNVELLPNATILPGCPHQIKNCAAIK